MKSSVIYARYDSITPWGGQVGLIAGNESGQRVAAAAAAAALADV